MKKVYLLLLTVLSFAATRAQQVVVTATAGTTGPTNYINLSSAFAAINAGTHQGAIIVNITASFTDAAVSVLNSSGAGSALYTSVLVQPSVDGVTMSFPSATGRGVIELNGADNVTINGDNPNTGGTNRNLTITNTAANTITFTSVIRLATSTLITSCDNDVIKNCNLNGSGTGRNISSVITEVTTWGVVASGGASTAAVTTAPSALASATTTIASGQTATALTIDNNNIQVASRGISVNGAATTVSSGLLITNNVIGNPAVGAVDQVWAVGITAQGTANGIIRGNTVRVEGYVESSTPNRAIDLGMVSTAGVTGVTIEKNIVERMVNNDAGSWPAYGINITGGNGDIIQNNFIGNCINSQVAGTGAFSTTFGAFGIRIAAGTGHKIYHNSVSFTGAFPGAVSTDLVACLCIVSTTSTGMDIRNNIFSNKLTGGNPTPYNTVFACVYVPSITAMTLTLNNNAYFQGSAAYSGIGQVSATGSAANLYTSANFNAGATTPATNWRAVTSAMGTATNDNSSFGFNTTPPFVSSIDLHIPAATTTPLESSGAAVGVASDIDGDVRNATTPDIGADEFAGVYVDLTAPTISYTALTSICSGADRTLTGVNISDVGGVPTTGSLRPRIYYKKNSGSYFSQPGTLTSGTGTSGTWDFTIVSADMGGLTAGDIVSYYVIAQDIAGTPNISSNPSGVVATDVNTVTTHPAAPNTYGVGASLNGTYTVGVGGNFTTLTSAVATYNAGCGLTGPVIFSLIDATYPSETFPITINQNAAASAVNTLTIKPAAGVNSTISGSLASNAVIKILGNYVTIDGSNSGGASRNLTLTNTNTTGPTVLLIGSVGTTPVTNSGVKNCIVINGANTASAILVGDAPSLVAAAGYFNNITIQNNSVQRAYIGIYNWAATAAGNGSGLLITQNDLSTSGANSLRLVGIYVQGTDGATVSNNAIGNMANTLDAANLTGIWLATATVNTTISGNTISGISGTATAPRGIAISSGIAATNLNINGNTITGLSSAVAQAVSGIMLFSTTQAVTIQNNVIRDIKNSAASGAYGLNLQTTSTGAGIIVNNNMISDVAALGSATVASNGAGIFVSAGSGYSIYYNTVNLISNQTTAAGLPAAMMVTSGVSAAGAINLRNNIFVNSQTGGSTQRYAIYSGAANTVYAAIDYNDYFTTTGPNLGFIGSNRVDLPAIVTGFGGNANSKNILPVFTTATNMHLNAGYNPTLNNLGITIAGFTTDIDGDIRGASPDMGADEFTPCTPPTTATASSNSPVCAGSTLNLIGTTDGTSYLWSGPNSFSSTSQNPSIPVVTTAAAGVYTFQSFLAGCPSLASTTTVVINPQPVVASVGASSTFICSGASVNLTASGSSNLPPSITLLSEGFEGGAVPAGWASINSGTGNLWTVPAVLNGTAHSGTFAAEYLYNSAQGANAYLITSGLALTGGVTYSVSSWYKSSGSTFPERLKITVGTAQTVAAQTTVVQDIGNVTSATYAQQTATFTPAVSGTYYFAWNAYSLADEFYLDVDDILIQAPPAPTYSWTSVPAGFTSVLQNPTVPSQTVNTTYIVTLSNGLCTNTGSVTVNINNPDVVATPASQISCTGSAIVPIVLTSTTPGVTTYTWTRNNPGGSGGPLSGSGNITGVFTNSTSSPITITFTIVPTAAGCTGTGTYTATVTVSPTPDITQPTDQSVCNNTATAAVVFTGATAGTTYNWTNNTPSIGLAASGSGDIPSFTATNATSAPVIATITVTPVITNSVVTTFNYTGAMQTFTVPAGITSIVIDVYGAQGSVGNVNTGGAGGTGGKGSKASGTLTVTPGQVLNIFVGGAGTQPAGGYNGGGTGGTANAGGGGGASDVRFPGVTAANRIIVGGGGGGGGTAGCNTAAVGGNGGNGAGNGSNGQDAVTPGGFAGGGAGAIGVTFGAKGIGCAGFSGTDGATAINENGAGGGTGQSCCCPSQPGGGGGGGGFLGGGGGGGGSAGTTSCSGNDKGGGGGGAGGSNYVGGVSGGSTTNGVQTGNGMVVITYSVGPSCPGTPKSFTITVKPTPVAVATPASQSVCSGTPITTIVNTSTTVSTTFAWTRDNNVNVTGIAASGTGDISGTLTSSTGVTETVTFTITPTANGCAGAPITATVTVNALPAFTNTNVEPSTCVSADGSITLNMTGPGGPYTFVWTGVGVIPGSQNQTGLTVGIYNVTVTVNATGCQSSASYTLLGPGGCFVCPTIPNMTANPSPVCTGSNVTLQTTGMTNMGITYGITFKYYAAATATPYVGGTVITTVPNGSLTAGGGTATATTSFATAGTYYIYAILSPTPVDPVCRPSNVVVLTVNSTPTLTLGTNPTICSGSITASLPFTSTFTGPNGNIMVNGGFETGSSAPWGVASAVPAPTISGAAQHSGSFSYALGKYGAAGDAAGDCSVYQTVSIPVEGGTLNYWYKPTTADAISDDWQDAYITNTSGTILATVMHVANNSNAWTNVSFNMAAYAGQTVRVMFLVHNDGDGSVTNMYLDDVSINGPGGSPATYSITWNAPAPAQGFANVTNAPLPSNPTPITLAIPGAAAPGTYTGTITITNGGGCSTAPQTFSVTINPVPVVNAVANQVICNGGTTTAVSFTTPTTGPGTIVYNWVHTGQGIGLGPNGSGNIPAFTATNTGNTPAVATITVTATYTYNGVSCTGAPVSFTITVNPTPTVNAVANQTVCHNTATTAVTFSGAVAGTVYNWTNNNATIGLAASGTGNIASFTATNAGTAPVVATITVTPSYTNGAVTCTGTPTSFTITVNPRPTVNAVANQTVCNGSPTAAVNFTSATAGATYAWTNSNTAIGLAASGTGNIGSFIATNTTALPISGTITVTPSFAGCAGTPITFTITVNASPTVNPVPGNQLLCNGSATAPITLDGPVSGAFYTWTNNQPSIGLASVGAGNIPSFIATNTGTAPVVATVVVTGSFTTGGTTCTGPSISFTITVNPTASINAIANQTVCNGATNAATTISGPVPGTLFTWTNSNSSIGLAPGGTGNVPAFTAINNTSAPIVATITVNADASSGGLNCPAAPVTYTITVNPTATVNAPSSQTVCNGSPTAAVNFTGAVAGTTYSWTNSNTAIGLGASGTGNIPSFTATNATAAAISGTITVTPSAAGCTGTPMSFTITVNPTAVVNQPSNQTLCNGASTAAINFTGTPVGVSFSWTNNNTSIGLAASGTGNIPSFVATNTTQAPVTATITVTPSIAGAICTGASKTFTITVNPLTNITFTNAPPRVCLTDTTVILTATPAGGVWSGPGVVGNTFSASLAGVGVKTLTYSTTSGCGTSATVNITVNDCIDRHNVFATSIRLYPNPSNGAFYIRFLSDLYKEFNVKIIDNDGRVMRDFHFTGLMYGSVIPMNLRNLPSDTYILQVYNAQEKANFRFVIVH